MKNKLYAGWAEAGGELPIVGLSEKARRAHIEQVEKLSKPNLAQFTGSETLYQIALFNRTLATEGAKFVADTAGAWWLLDTIVSYQFNPTVKKHTFQVWTITVWEDRTATLEAQDGNGNLIISHEVKNTDFPVPEMTFWYDRRGIPTIMLPSEY